MAQDTRTITIEIVSSSSSKEKDNFSALMADGSENLKDKINPMNSKTGKIDKSLFGKSILVQQSIQTAKQLIKSGIDGSINRYFSLSEDYINETNYKNVKTAIGKAASAVTTIGAGFTMGGPVGAVVAAVGWAGNEALSILNKHSAYYSSLNVANYSTQFSRTRASLYDNGKGTEN